MTRLDGSAVVSMCWDHGGSNLIGLVVVRRPDARCFFVDLPADLAARLAVLDRQYVAANAARLLAVARAGLSRCSFVEDEVISPEFLQTGAQPAHPGSMRHIPAETVARAAGEHDGWRMAGFIVDVGEIPLDPERVGARLH